MKKIFYLFFFTLVIFAGCKKSSFESVFDKSPEERMADAISLVNTSLTSSPNGWIATMPTFAGGGYSFYMNFDANQNVTMYSDISDAAATNLGTSTYRVTTGLGAMLAFDTYNYISVLQDPKASVYGGVQGSGFSSDVEFTYVKSTADSLILVGRQFRQLLRMVKATPAQKAAYVAGGLKTSMDKVKAFFAAIKNPYIEVVSGATTIKTGMSVNFTNVMTTGKRIGFTGVLADNKTVLTGNSKFAFTLNGADMLGDGLVYNGITFVRMGWKDATTMAFYDSTGKEYIIKSSPVPLTPLALLFGFPTTFPYKKIAIGTALPAGVSSGFTAVYNQMLSLFAASGRSVVSTNFILVSNSVFRVEINYLSGTSPFVASADYNYTKVDNVITLDNVPVPNVNWPTRAVQIKPLADYMLTGPFKIDWVTSTDPNSPVLGGLYRTADLTSFIYGTL